MGAAAGVSDAPGDGPPAAVSEGQMAPAAAVGLAGDGGAPVADQALGDLPAAAADADMVDAGIEPAAEPVAAALLPAGVEAAFTTADVPPGLASTLRAVAGVAMVVTALPCLGASVYTAFVALIGYC